MHLRMEGVGYRVPVLRHTRVVPTRGLGGLKVRARRLDALESD
jgi:hypothetical protein